MCYCRFFCFLFALIAGDRASMQPGAHVGRVRSSDPGSTIAATRSVKLVALPISNLPIGPVSRTPNPHRGTLEKKIRNQSIATGQLVARFQKDPLILPFRCPIPRPVNRIGSLCDMLHCRLVVLIVARFYLERFWRLSRTRQSLDPVSATPSNYCKETTGIGRLQCCCSCNVREQTACTFLFLICCFAEYANAAGGR